MIKLLKALFLGFATLTTLHGEMLFDLQEQYFEHMYTQSSQRGLYKLPNVSVSSINILQSKDGRYVTEFASSGSLIVRLNEVRENFSVSIKARYRSTYLMGKSSIVLKSSDGEEFIILFNKNKITVQNKSFAFNKLDKKMLNIAIRKVDKYMQVFIDGSLFTKYEMPAFVTLKRVEQTINNVSGVASEDSIYDMVIAGK